MTTTIYAYTLPDSTAHVGQIKVGQTDRDVKTRVDESAKVLNARTDLRWHGPVWNKKQGRHASDHEVRAVLADVGFKIIPHYESGRPSEWVECELSDVLAAVAAIETGSPFERERHETFAPREEQQAAIDETYDYFTRDNHESAPRFLWNAKMRFGKTFTTYQLAKKMDLKRILVLTYKPAVSESWRSDLMSHKDFSGWHFFERTDKTMPSMDSDKPLVWFASFQDVLGKSGAEGQKRMDALVATDWDLVVFDEYHFGAWRESAQEVISEKVVTVDQIEKDAATEADAETVENVISGRRFLYLSGTPFRALAEGEFSEDQIFNWTYPDEQKRKREHERAGTVPNLYASLPTMMLRTYALGDMALTQADQGVNVFNLKDLFDAKKVASSDPRKSAYKFVRSDYVEQFLRTICGQQRTSFEEGLVERDLHVVTDEPAPQMPFADTDLRHTLRHTVWYLPDVAACYAMAGTLAKDPFFGRYRIVNIGGDATGTGADALVPVRDAIGLSEGTGRDPGDGKPTVTLSCGKLMTGVTVPEWTGIFMLRNLNKPESYFQAAFRVQSPWTASDPSEPGGKRVLKDTCFIFDFDPQRALRLVSEMATSLSVSTTQTPEQKVADFTEFLPIFFYDDGRMQQVEASEVLQIADASATSTMMTRKWSNSNLVNLSEAVFAEILDDDGLVEALDNLEQFRKGKDPISTKDVADLVISSNDKLRKAKAAKRKPTASEDDEAKTARKKKAEMRKALVRFLQRIPAFMYVTDQREAALIDVIQAEEGRRFERATGMSLDMFDRLRNTGALNNKRIDAAIIAFRQFENASLAYAGNYKDRDDILGGMFRTYNRDEQRVLSGEAAAAVAEGGPRRDWSLMAHRPTGSAPRRDWRIIPETRNPFGLN